MFEKFREYWLDRAFKTNARKHTFLNLNKMQNILILFDYEDLMEIILLGNNLEKMGKRTHLWSAVENIKQLETQIFSKKTRIIKPVELSNVFILKKEVYKEFSNLEYDTVIDIRQKKTQSLEYLLARNKAVFCIGNRKHDRNAFDFCVLQQKGKSILETYEQMKFYLQNIKD